MGNFIRQKFEPAAVEEDSGAEVFEGAEASGLGLDGLDTTIEAFTHGIGDPVVKVAEDVFEMTLEHLGHLDDGFQLTTSGPTIPPRGPVRNLVSASRKW